MIVPPVAGMAVIYGRYVRSISKQTQDALAQATQVRPSSLCTSSLVAIAKILLAPDCFVVKITPDNQVCFPFVYMQIMITSSIFANFHPHLKASFNYSVHLFSTLSLYTFLCTV